MVLTHDVRRHIEEQASRTTSGRIASSSDRPNEMPVNVTWDTDSVCISCGPSAIAVPHTAAGIAGGTIGLALSHAFEALLSPKLSFALYPARCKMTSRWWASWAAAIEVATAWLNTIDANRATRRLDNIDPKTNQRVPAPDPHATSVIPARGPRTTLIDAATGGLENGKTTTAGDGRITKRL
jgi:hypothetical protein